MPPRFPLPERHRIWHRNGYLYASSIAILKLVATYVCLLCCFAISPARAQTRDSSGLLEDQNPNHNRSRDKYTKPNALTLKEKPVLPDTVKAVPNATVAPAKNNGQPGAQETYLKNLKKAEEHFVSKGNYKDAYEISQLLKQANDSLAMNETRQRILQEKLRYDSLQQAEKTRAYQKDIFQKQREVESSRKIVYLVIAALALALLLALAFYRNYRNTRKANRIIARQQEETEEKKRLIEASLHEKEILLKEIHHRVKNNLQIISSLLNLQASRTGDAGLKRIMEEARNRVSSMALIHQKIYQSGNLSTVDFQAYTGQMAQSVDANFNTEKKRITQQVNTNGIALDIDTSIPLGLIINELLTNSYKYAFAGREAGHIGIELYEADAAHLELHVYDDGIGLPDTFDPARLSSLGLKLVKGLAAQLKGEVRFESRQGTHCFIRFKKPVNT